MRKRIHLIILLLILFFSFLLRVYRLDQNPPSLNWDEVSHGYNAYSIWKTGRDEWGARFPLIFRAYGDYKLPLYIYLTAPLVGIFGLNAYSVRLISVLSGLGLVAITYFMAKKITRNDLLSLLAAFLTAVSPWSLFVSRAALEANLGAFLFAVGMYFWLDWLEEASRVGKLTLAVLFWGLSLYAYNSARVLVPLFFVISVFLFWRRKISLKKGMISLLFGLIFLIPLLGQFLNRSGQARFELVNLTDQGAVNQIIALRGSSPLPKPVARVLYNRPTFFIFYALRGYLSNLSPKYLFFRGGSHYQFSFPNHELVYLVAAPFLLLGLILALFKGEQKEKVLAAWFLLAFIPSAITRDAPHVLRSILVLPSPMILTVLGLGAIENKIRAGSRFKGKLLISILFLAAAVSFARWWNDYWKIYPQAYSWAWQYGYQEVFSLVKEHYQEYERIFITKRYGEPHEFALFNLAWEPRLYQNDKNRKWDYHADWFWIDGFDKFSFVNDWEIGKVSCQSVGRKAGKCLLITSPENYPAGWQKIKTINFMDGKAAFEILEKSG